MDTYPQHPLTNNIKPHYSSPLYAVKNSLVTMGKIYSRTDLQRVFEYFVKYRFKVIPIDINEGNPSPYDFYPLESPHLAASNFNELTQISPPQCYYGVILGPENKDLIVLRTNAKDEKKLSEKCEFFFSKIQLLNHSAF